MCVGVGTVHVRSLHVVAFVHFEAMAITKVNSINTVFPKKNAFLRRGLSREDGAEGFRQRGEGSGRCPWN